MNGEAEEKRTDAGVLEMRGISIAFPGVLALDGVNFRAETGRAHPC